MLPDKYESGSKNQTSSLQERQNLYIDERGLSNPNQIKVRLKVQFRGPELFMKRGGTISRRILPTWYLYAFVNKLTIRLCMDGLNLNVHVILFFFADMILSYGSHCIDMTASPRTYQQRHRHVVVMFCNVWLAESSSALALWRHDHNVDDQNMVFLPIVGGRLAMFTEGNLTSKYNVNEMKSL